MTFMRTLLDPLLSSLLRGDIADSDTADTADTGDDGDDEVCRALSTENVSSFAKVSSK
jgi:hypothetical protein